VLLRDVYAHSANFKRRSECSSGDIGSKHKSKRSTFLSLFFFSFFGSLFLSSLIENKAGLRERSNKRKDLYRKVQFLDFSVETPLGHCMA